MFWRVASGSVSSEPELLLSKEDITLDEILAAPYIVQEVNTSNKDAVKLLTRDDVLDSLVDKIIAPPKDGDDEAESSESRLVACEIICSECVAIANAMFARKGCIVKLLKAVETTSKSNLEGLRAIARVVAHLLSHDPKRLMILLQENVSILEGFVPLAGNLDVAETLTRLLGADDEGPAALKAVHLDWLRQSALLDKLIEQMEAEESLQSEYAAEILAAIARARICPLTQDLASIRNLSRILNYASANSQSARFIRALNICISLVERRRVWDEAARSRALHSEDPNNPDLPEMPDPDSEEQLEAQAVNVIAPKAAEFMDQLAQEQSSKHQETPYGILHPPLGSGRLTVMALISVLLRTGLPSAEDVLMDSGLLAQCLTLMTAYPFNSILHQQVTVILAGVLESGSTRVITYMFEDCKLLDWLTTLPSKVEVAPNSSVLPLRKPQILQAGYTGHITQIANRILHAGAMRQEVHEYVMEHKGWHMFMRDHIQVANERQDVAAWECGRPKVALDSVESVGHDLLDDELAANMEYRGSKAFGLAMKSAFSSGDSDEDDEEDTADMLFEDADAMDSNFESEEAPTNGRQNSRFKIRQVLPSFVDDWEDLAEEGDEGSDLKSTPRPQAVQRAQPPSSPFSKTGPVKHRRSSMDDIPDTISEAVEIVDTGNTDPDHSRADDHFEKRNESRNDNKQQANTQQANMKQHTGENIETNSESRANGEANESGLLNLSSLKPQSLPPLSLSSGGSILSAVTGNCSPVIGSGILKQALQPSIHIDDPPHKGSPIFSSSFPPGEPTFSTNSPSSSSSSSAMNSPMDKSPIDKSPISLSPRAPEARSSNRTRKSDKDSKLEIMRADLKDDLMAEINASLADELLAEDMDSSYVKKKSSKSAKSGRSQSQKPAGNRNEEDRKHSIPNGSNVIASSREEDISGTSSNTWLDADQLRDVRKTNNSAILLP